MPEDVNDVSNWRLEDPNPGTSLNSILPYSRRAESLLARKVAHPILQTDFLQVAGTVSILKGLDYHRDRFVEIITKLASGETIDQEYLLHEAVAYVNRGGQYYYFAKSSLVTQTIGQALIPHLDKILQFRHKHSAHRSVDKPRREDIEQLQTVHAMSLSEYGGRLWIPRSPNSTLGTPPFWGRAFLGYQIHTDPNDVIELIIERDHNALMQESFSVLETLLK